MLALAVLAATAASAQVASLYYKEVAKEGRVYVFNTPETLKLWQESGEMGKSITLIGRGEHGETLVAENETAADLYFFRHNLDGYDRPTPKPSAPAAFPATKISGRVFADFSTKTLKDEGTGTKSGDSGLGADVKRFYFTVRHDFDARWSAQFQSDIGDQGARRYDVFVKQAYIQAKLSPAATFRLGSAATAWIPFVEDIYGNRYLENTITDRFSFGNSADWGLHFLGTAAGDKLSYALSAENGRGFSNPGRSKNVDFEGRVAYSPVKGLTFAVGGYSGTRGLETDAAPSRHTAKRTNVLAAYGNDKWKVGGEWFETKNWNTVAMAASDKADGFSVWGSFAASGKITLFARYDQADPSKDLRPKLEDTYYNAGLQYRVNKSLAAALVYKHEEAKGGITSTQNGTIGSNVAGAKGKLDEAGVWLLYDF